MKKTILAAMAAVFMAGYSLANAQALDEADKLFDKNTYDAALAKYEIVIKTGAGDEKLKAVYRAVECEALLFRYTEALKRAFAVKLPPEPVWKARFLLLRAEAGNEFLQQYGYSLPTDIEEGALEPEKRTKDQWLEEIAASYLELWDLRRTLVGVRLKDEGYFVDLKNADLSFTPTFWDFAALKWSDFARSNGAGKRAAYKIRGKSKFTALAERVSGPENPPAEEFLAASYGKKFSSSLPAAEFMAVLFEESHNLPRAGREAAAEVWKIKRFLLPFSASHLVTPFKDHQAGLVSAIAALKNLMGSFSSELGKSEAGYETAVLLNQSGKYKETVELCRKVEKEFSGARAAGKCSKLKAQIEMPSLSLAGRFAPPPGKKALKFTAKNVNTVFFRLYRTSPEDLREKHEQDGYGRNQAWQNLRYISSKAVEKFLSYGRPEHSWSVNVKYKKEYSTETADAGTPALKPGIYVAVVSNEDSFTPGSSMIQAALINITRLALIGNSGIHGHPSEFLFDPANPNRQSFSEIFHIYSLNAVSGLPEADLEMQIFRRIHYGAYEKISARSGADGTLHMSFPVSLYHSSENHYGIDPLAERNGNYAWWPGEDYFSYYTPSPAEIFLETDRPIYRPGQKVKFKATVLLRIPGGYKVYDGQSKLYIAARDANYGEFFKKEFVLNKMGGAAGSFIVPSGKLLGQYSISASLSDFGRNFSQAAYFGVEEYKRPEFEVILDAAKGIWKYGEKARVEGSVKYYFGGAAPDAAVKYKVYRQRHIPWFCWWWSWYYAPSARSEMLSGDIKTDESGKFSFEFTPAPENESYKDYPSSFFVEIEARDAGGRTITGSKSYNAGSKAYLFDIKPQAGFMTENKSSEISLRLLDINEKQLAGSASWEIYKIEGKPEYPQEEGYYYGYPRSNQPPDQAFKNAKNGKKAASGEVKFYKNKPASVKVPALPEGAYRFEVKADDPFGGKAEQSVVLLCSRPAGAPNKTEFPPVTIAERESYRTGETARILLGSSELKGAKYAEIWKGNFLLSSKLIKEPGVSVLEIPVGKKHKGGFFVRWFGVSDFKNRGGQISLKVPEPEREISLSLDYDKVVKPGKKVFWTLRAKDSQKKPVNGEALVRVFDRSLEYYQKEDGQWVSSLFRSYGQPDSWTVSVFNPPMASIQVKQGWLKQMTDLFRSFIKEPVLPALRMNRSRLGGYRDSKYDGEYLLAGAATLSSGGSGNFAAMRGRAKKSEMLSEEKAMAPQAAAAEGASFADKSSDSAVRREAAAEMGQVQARKDFSETALFRPQLAIKNGRGSFSFRMPERLTSWKISGYAITPDVKRGLMSFEAVTKKDLMVRVEMPRFFREKDAGRIKAIVSNETDSEMSGELLLSVERNGDRTYSELGLAEADLLKSFSVKPRSVFTGTWEITAPSGVTVYDVKAVARSGAKTDAEVRTLPILPSRQRLIKTSFVSLDGNAKKTLEIKELKKADPSRENESMTLQIDPQLALTVINSMPLLIRYPHECTEQLVNRYTPLAIVNSFYKKYPALREAVKKIPKRTTLTRAWDREDPLRLMTLMETPWENVSKGRESYYPVIDLFNAKFVAAQAREALEKLKTYQLSDGSFPWFPGGRPSLHMTLYALESFAEASKYGVAVDEGMAKRAIAYVNSEIPRHMKPDEASTSYILYAAYVLTSFPKTWSETAQSFKMAKLWADYADKNSRAMTPFGKAYAAWIYFRLNEKDKAYSYLDRAMDGSREDEDAGLYWTPEKISWLWYNDTVEKHAFILRTLQTLRPKDKRIEPMLKWLLFNRKGNEWKSTKATAAAIYSILDIMKNRGALDKPDNYSASWGGEKYAVTAEPFDWLAKPFRFVKTGKDIDKKDSQAVVEKEGPGFGFASLTLIFTTDRPAEASGPGIMELGRKYFLRYKEGDDYRLKPLALGETVKVGDQLEIQLTVKTKSQFEYVHLKDPKPAGFEAEELKSGWKWEQLSRYEEPRDSLTNFFMDWLPHGEYVLKYRLKATTPGKYRIGSALMQSMYAPEFSAYSDGMEIKVIEE